MPPSATASRGRGSPSATAMSRASSPPSCSFTSARAWCRALRSPSASASWYRSSRPSPSHAPSCSRSRPSACPPRPNSSTAWDSTGSFRAMNSIMRAPPNNMWIIKHRIIFFLFSALILGFSVFSVLYYGFNFGIDFTGGSIVEVGYPAGAPSIDEVKSAVATVVPTAALVQPSGAKDYIIRPKELDATKHAALLYALAMGGKYQLSELQYNLIGPSIGTELKQKAWIDRKSVV